jgi:cyclophilin family peptidyl-prolyl cis-trans isomerase
MKKYFCFLLVIIFAVMPLTACNDSSDDSSKGNIGDLSEPGPGDIYMEIKFLDYDERVVLKLFPELAPVAVEEVTKRAERGFYDGRNMHRVIKDYIIQGGSVNFDGTEGNVELLELFNVESSPYARNFYGAIALVSDELMYNYCQFYIVVNKNPVDIDAEIEIIQEFLAGARELTDEAKARLQSNLNIMAAIPENIKQQYLTRGGLPHLDGRVTVFGQLVSGGNVIDAIAASYVAGGNSMDDADGIPSKPVEEIIIEFVNIIRIPPLSDEEEEAPAATTPRATTAPPPPIDGVIDIDLNEPAGEPPAASEPDEPDIDDDTPGVLQDEPDEEE